LPKLGISLLFKPLFIILCIHLGCTAGAAKGCLDSQSTGPAELALDSALLHLQNQDYGEAQRLWTSPLLAQKPLGMYFRGLHLIQLSEDEGDTLAFHQADKLWPEILKRLQRTDSLLEGLTLLQWAGTQQKLGHSWSALRHSLKAKKILAKQVHCPEAQGALALLEYYRDQLLPKWVPGTRSAQECARELRQAAEQCHRLQPLLLGAWVWTQFDLGQWKDGLKAIAQLLEGHPRHRLYLQMRGDFEFRSGDFTAARETYELARSLYPRPSRYPGEWKGRLPLGYLSCTGNLARIEAALHQNEKALSYLAIWEDPLFQPAQKWLPASLKKALKPLRGELANQALKSYSE
jgi:hypothetical protein